MSYGMYKSIRVNQNFGNLYYFASQLLPKKIQFMTTNAWVKCTLIFFLFPSYFKGHNTKIEGMCVDKN